MRLEDKKYNPSNPSIKFKRLGYLFVSLLSGILLWGLLVNTLGLPSFILPSPSLVWDRFLKSALSGQLWYHTLITLAEVIVGLLIGGFAATITGYLLAKFSTLEKILSPYLVASQAIPIVAIAPLLVIWFGSGMFSKILISSLTVFFPILINTLLGLREVPQDLKDLMRTLESNPSQTFWKLEVPSVLPIYLGGLRIGATLSVIGAVVGELVGADRGLGFLINVGRGQYDTALVFVALFTLIITAMALYGLVLLLETRLLSWQPWRRDLG